MKVTSMTINRIIGEQSIPKKMHKKKNELTEHGKTPG